MSFTMQVERLVARGAKTMYALGTLKNHGLNNCAPMGSYSCHTSIAAHRCVTGMVGDVGWYGAPTIARYHQ